MKKRMMILAVALLFVSMSVYMQMSSGSSLISSVVSCFLCMSASVIVFYDLSKK